ncbi:hypothetical protein [Microvirga calopogonii]|uniref:hypothetical protein n=1 Tax=Microvirga calopogonii TaxID=2078013 RepID=UPI000E0D12C2|nr:hypothetical protein [Microvirga calopogonii]
MTSGIEPRWHVALTVLVLLGLNAVLPEHHRAAPFWVSVAAVTIACLAMAGVTWAVDKPRWLRIETIIMRIITISALAAQVASLATVIHQIVGGAARPSGLTLLASGLNVWTSIVLAFAVLFWQLDRGGPAGRMEDPGRQADWLFPEAANPEAVRPGWQPMFVDYLFLSFSTATAFSTTDAAPLTSRAKLLMMLESAIALTTLVVVASRAINALGA